MQIVRAVLKSLPNLTWVPLARAIIRRSFGEFANRGKYPQEKERPSETSEGLHTHQKWQRFRD
jgi:hypothetical protein